MSIKKIIKGFLSALVNPSKYIVYINQHNNYKYAPYISDKIYIKSWYKERTGKKLHLFCPKDLNEKLQWLKLYDRNPVYSKMADKAEAKAYIASKIGLEYIVPTIGIWSSFDEIDFSKLPDQFVLKCTHDSGSVVLCKDKQAFDYDSAKELLTYRLQKNYFWSKREWPYKNITPRIICEPLLSNKENSPLVDYKFYCYGGKPRYFMCSIGEAEHNVKNHKFDMNLNSIDYLFKEVPTLDEKDVVLPDNINEMISIVEKLCSEMKHIRVDLYNIDGRIYVGELTFFSGAGILNIRSKEYADELASYIVTKKKVNGEV